MAKKRLKVTLMRGTAGKLRRHRATIRGLGLRRAHHSVVLDDTPEVRGMLRQVGYMLQVEPAE